MIKFPKTPHLPFNAAAATDNDIVADETAIDIIQSAKRIVIQEKLDGANLRICFDGENEPIIGNREHILKKGYIKKNTPAKLQFRPVWNWIYSNKKLFANLTRIMDVKPIVFGEWMFAQHTICYDRLTTYFFAYDICVDDVFLDPIDTIELLTAAGFTIPPVFNMLSMEELLTKLDEPSSFSSTDLREGLYFKVGNGDETTHRFKLLRHGYKTVDNFTDRGLIKNRLA